MDLKNKQKELQKIAQEVDRCKRCPLWKNPKAVPGEGNPEAKVLLIGEAPGYYESVQGRPFVGAAGNLLTDLLKSIGLERSGVFICNMLRHRPPDNRDPLPTEIEACRPWLDKQIEIIQPKIVVTLGRFSMAKFLPEAKISRVHGQPQSVEFQGRKVTIMPLYHPAAGLRREEILDDLKTDFLKLGELLKASPQSESSREQLSLV